MAEAREKLVEMCEGLAPKDIVARDAIVGLIEDLGLNGRVKEQKLGFRGQRLSIKEKVELSKRKVTKTILFYHIKKRKEKTILFLYLFIWNF